MPIFRKVDKTSAKLIERLEAARSEVRAAQPGSLRAAVAELDLAEIWASTHLAGSPLDRAEADALVRRGVALGGHPLEAYVRVADYARAARFVRESPSSSRRRGFLTVEELVRLHALATQHTSDRPGRLRETTLPQLPGGMIASPAWMIPQSLAAFVDRVHGGPTASGDALTWIADAHARYERIHPFAEANGRVGRLLINLLLKRCGYVPFVCNVRDTGTYIAARRAADSREVGPLTRLLARSLAQSYAFLAGALPHQNDARPLSSFATGSKRAALYKAAQRNRLQAFRRDGRLMTTAAWIADYEGDQSSRKSAKAFSSIS